jgi:hypothetical protein
MGEVAHATTDERGHYSLAKPANGPYLVRATHQGATYFIGAPEGNGPGDITVFDVAAKVNGVSIEDDIFDVESENGQLDVTERYLVHNASSPRVTQLSANTFEFVLPTGAVLDGAAATRPSGLPTNAIPKPLGEKGHFTFNVPIQPDEGENQTLFEIHYHLPYAGGKYTFKPQVLMPVDNFAIRLPKSIAFTPGAGLSFRPVGQNPAVQTFLLKNVLPGKPLEFSVSGNGALPREQGGQQADNGGGSQAMGGGSADAGGQPGNQPGGGIGTPIGTPDPLSKYKWWILGGLALLLAAAAAFLLQKPAPGSEPVQAFASPANRQSALLNALKEELFALESEKLSGTLPLGEYSEVKAALETVLKRALKRQS